jgi:hypothetical protein
LGNIRGPIIPIVFTTEEIYPLIAVEEFKKVAWRKCFFALDAWKFHHAYTSESFHRILAGLSGSPMQTQCQKEAEPKLRMVFEK